MRYKIEYEKKIKKYLELNAKIYKYYTDTMGCALNENDTLKYRGILEVSGFIKTDNIEEANIVLFNTCCIRENAEDRLFGRLGTLKNRKKTDKNLYICVVGCMTEQCHVIEKIQKSYSFIDIVLGTKSMKNFAEKVFYAISENKKEQCKQKTEFEILEGTPIIYEEGFKATISIIYGCNNFCSYCIVPYVRGREKSRLPEDILKDIKDLAERGYREITLLGQNVNSYGKDFSNNLKKYNFVKLLSEIEKVEGIEIIKFLSPHPKDFTDELIEHISKSKKISKQIHLPLQSGSTKILELMNRKYTKTDYLKVVEKIKEKISLVSFSTDVIVGFPGETKEDFEETLEVINQVNFDQIYMFCYSKRKGTVAEKMENQVLEVTKVERLKQVKTMLEKIVFDANEKIIGKEFEILVEGKSKNNEEKYMGRTKENKIVVFDSKKEDLGKIKKIKITDNHLWYLGGSIIN